MSRNSSLYQSTLEDLIKLQPNNQTILAEYYTSKHEEIPRNMRRLRTNQTKTATSKSSVPTTTTDTELSKVTKTVEICNLTYEELEQIRAQKASSLVITARHQFEQQLNSLKPDDIKGQCSLIIRLPAKGLFKIIGSANPKVVEIIINVCRVMVNAEKFYQQQHKSSILQFSYVKFCFNLLIELTTLPRLDSALLMMDKIYQAALDDLISYFSSLSSILPNIEKLDRLKSKD